MMKCQVCYVVSGKEVIYKYVTALITNMNMQDTYVEVLSYLLDQFLTKTHIAAKGSSTR